MTARKIRTAAIVLLTVAGMTLLSGCWDNHELDAMFIVTGVGLDETSTRPDQMDITLQVGETKQGSAGSGEANTQEDSSLLMNVTSDTVLSGVMKLNQESSHKLLLNHNQVLLLGSSLAEQGVENRLDMFLRDQQARMEVPVMVVDGRAEDVLSVQPDQDKISGIFLSRMLNDLAGISKKYQVRMLDFVSCLLDGTSSPIAPMITVAEEEGKQKIELSGMAVFKGDRMIGQLDRDEVDGYIWSMGPVKRAIVEAGGKSGKAVFRIAKMNCRRKVTLRRDGGVNVSLSVVADLNVNELSGFDNMTIQEVMPVLTKLAQDEIRQKILGSFEAAQRMDADIYRFGTAVHGQYPKQWRTMKGRWDELFRGIRLDVHVKVNLPAIGEIEHSLEMKEE